MADKPILDRSIVIKARTAWVQAFNDMEEAFTGAELELMSQLTAAIVQDILAETAAESSEKLKRYEAMMEQTEDISLRHGFIDQDPHDKTWNAVVVRSGNDPSLKRNLGDFPTPLAAFNALDREFPTRPEDANHADKAM